MCVDDLGRGRAKNELPALTSWKLPDKWVLCPLNTLIAEVTENLGTSWAAVQKVHDSIWDTTALGISS